MNLFALIPKIMQAIALIDSIKTALNAGEPILAILNRMGSEFINFFTDVAKVLFPGLKPDQQAAAGINMLDYQYVVNLQTAMNRLENAGLKVDGVYGELTKKAVTAFQGKHGLAADGWAGRLTSAIIQVELAKLAAPAEMAKALAEVKP